MGLGDMIGSDGESLAASGQDWEGSYDYYSDQGNNVSHVMMGEEECERAWLGAGFGALRAVLYCAVLVVGVPGNLALLGALWGRGFREGAVITRRKRSWRNGEILAANLAFSDLLFLAALPLWIHSEANDGEWRGGEAGCKMAPYVTALTMHVGVLLLTVMSIDRYLAVVHPGVYRRVRRKQAVVSGSCALCWLCAALLALPVVRVRELQRAEPEGPTYCGENGERLASYPPTLSLILLLLFFFLPLLAILTCYCSLVLTLQQHASSMGGACGSPTSLRRALRIVLLVGGAFLLCWLPYNTFKLLGLVERCLAPPTDCSLRGLAHGGILWTGVLGFTHSCINPLAYAAADQSLRQRVWRVAPCCQRRDGPVGGASSLTTPITWGEGGVDRESTGRWQAELREE